MSLDDAAVAMLSNVRDALQQCDFLAVERLSRELIRYGTANALAEACAVGYYHLGIALNNLNRGTEAIDATRQSISLYSAIGDRFAIAKAKMNLGAIELDNNVNAAEARRLYEDSEAVVRELGGPLNLAIALGNLGEICRLEGDYEGALRNGNESLGIFRDLEDGPNCIWQLTNVAHYHALLGRYGEAETHMGEAYVLLRADPNPRWLAWYFDVWFLLASAHQRWEIAAKLLAFVDKYRDTMNQPRLGAMLPWFSQPKERLARELPHDRHHEFTAAGEALTIETAQALAEAALE